MIGLGVRALSAQTLARVALLGESLRSALPAASVHVADARDRALFAAILFESTRWYLRLDKLLDQLLSKPIRARETNLHCLLIVGLTQIIYLDLPLHAAVAETVAAARELKRPHHAALVNAVLRRFLRERSALEDALDNDPPTRSSHPRWLVRQLQIDWPQHYTQILAGNNTIAPLWLRVNRRRAHVADLRQRLRDAGHVVNTHVLCADALVLEQSTDVTRLPGFAEGEFSVQDGAAQLASDLLDLRDGQRVLDACAAPGGKAAHILERADVQLLALDFDAARLPRMRENLQRLGVHAELRVADAIKAESWWDGKPFDRILLDAPCSATGIIRRQPDIKLHRRSDDLRTLIQQQSRLLDALWPMLSRGGRLVYATCSLLRDENEHQIARFLERNVQARDIAAIPQDWGIASGAGRQNFPGQQGMDGFFYAVMEKIS